MDNSDFGASPSERHESPLAQWTEALYAFSRGLRVAIPGVVKSFDPVKQTVSVLPALREMPKIAGIKTPKDLPLLSDVPVMMPRAGAFSLTMPITAGDECLVIFADMNIDAWWQQGAASGPVNTVDNRRHALSDGIAILGLWSQPRKVTNWSTTAAQLRNSDGTAVVEVQTNQVNVAAQTVSLTASGNVNVTALSQATVSAPTVNVSGSSAVNITGGNCSIDGKNFLSHKHSGVASGASQSGPVA